MMEPITPEEAVEEYLKHRKSDLSDSSHQNHGYRLDRWLEWCSEAGIDNMNEVTGRRIHEFTTWRAEQVNTVTLKTQLDTLRVFLKFCERIDGIPQGVSGKVRVPDLNRREDCRNVLVTHDQAREILRYLRKYEYASFRHALFAFLWHTGVRTGTARAIDVDDISPHKDRPGVLVVEIKHRPETGTPLKNKEEGEREVNILKEPAEIIGDYLEQHRKQTKDEYGRVPLFSTRNGRASRTTIRRNVYTITRPCVYTNRCPHDREIENCEAMKHDRASKCPSSVSPHALRRGAITHHLTHDVPKWVVSERMNVSMDVLARHYDGRTPAERREGRKSHLENI